MVTRLVDSGWSTEVAKAIRDHPSELRIVSPFIKFTTVQRLLSSRTEFLRAITRFSLSDFVEGVSDVASLRMLLAAGGSVRGIRHLHAKMYLFGSKLAIVTSANLTEAALTRNHEFGIISDERSVIEACRLYFDDLWARGGADLASTQLVDWEKAITQHRAEGGLPSQPASLCDFGVDAGFVGLPSIALPTAVAEAKQTFVKFLGEGSNRASLALTTLNEIQQAGCHWAVAYPASKRPRSVQNDAVIFIVRLTYDPNDIRVFGRAIALRHQSGRDDATPADIALRSWKETWSRYIRVHNAEFVAGTMANGVSLNELMDSLGADSFAATKRNASNGKGNMDPRRAYRQQAAVELSREGSAWLGERLQAAFARHGKVPQYDLDKLDWPQVPQ